MAAPLTSRPRIAPEPGHWCTNAFGLTLTGDFPVPGVTPEGGAGGPEATALRRAHLALASPGELEAAWAGTEPVELFRQPFPDGSASITLELDTTAGYRLWSAGFGSYLIAADGSRVLAAPPNAPPAHWQRLLVGHALPIAALLRGLELYHASAVVLRGRAIAIAGPSHGGKTSLAIQLVLRGGELLTDDALALEPAGVTVLAHPGAGIVNVRHPEWRRLPATARARLGWIAGIDADAARVVIARRRRPAPLQALVLTERGPKGSALAIEPVHEAAATLLRSTHNFVIRTSQRMATQLATCAAVAAAADVLHVRVPPDMAAEHLAEVLDERLA